MQRSSSFGFNSANYDISLIKSYLRPPLVNERRIEPIVIKKANHFVSSTFGDVQFLDTWNFLGRATSLDAFLKTYNTAETKGSFPYNWFDHAEKLKKTQLPSYETIFSKVCNNNSLKKGYSDFQSLTDGGLTSKEALLKPKLNQIPLTG